HPRLAGDDELSVAEREPRAGEGIVRGSGKARMVTADPGARGVVTRVEFPEQVPGLVPGLLQGGVERKLSVGQDHSDLLSRKCLAPASSGRKTMVNRPERAA